MSRNLSTQATRWSVAGICIAIAFAAAAAIETSPARTGALLSPTHASGAPVEKKLADAEAAFLDENDMAMNRMMNDMSIIASGDVDRDFVALMQPHHQGAIDMAEVFLRHGTNERLRRLAQEIIVTQREEIVAMRSAIANGPLPAAAATADDGSEGQLQGQRALRPTISTDADKGH